MANEQGNIKANCEKNATENCNNNESCNNERGNSRIESNSISVNNTENEIKSTTDYGIKNVCNNDTNVYKQTVQPQKREENHFSFTHFLNRDHTTSSTSTHFSASIVSTSNSQNNRLHSYQPPNCCNSNGDNVETSNSVATNSTKNDDNENNISIDEGESTSNKKDCNTQLGMGSKNPYQSSTGARPKVPQSISNSFSVGLSGNKILQTPISISTISMSSLTGSNENSKMKRSPRFSSFDSQASLAECAAGSRSDFNTSGIYTSASGGFLRDGVSVNSEETAKPTSALFVTSSEYDRQFIPRSYSNYDIEIEPAGNNRCSNSSTPRRNESTFSPLRPKNSTTAVRPTRLMGISTHASPGSPQHTLNSTNANPSGNVFRPNSEFAAAALPDFVQDHWMDQWYYNEMHLNSPPNSPNQSPIDFVEDLPAMTTGEKCQTLPDFLSDGPIIHSSGRLADVAAGLPDMDSPEDSAPSLQLSRLRLENERLRRELDESRIALSDQMRRNNDLERRLDQFRNQPLASSKIQNNEPKRSFGSQNKQNSNIGEAQISTLKTQLKDLSTEINTLRKENEQLKAFGAAGGESLGNRKPSKNQYLSKELMRAASTAETNLKQLLIGVDNLKLLAKTLCDNPVNDNSDGLEMNMQNSPSTSAGATSSNPHNSVSINKVKGECLSDCDDIDDYNGSA